MSRNQGLVFWQETTWTHVLTMISEKTDFSIYLVLLDYYASACGLFFKEKENGGFKCNT